MNILQLNTSIRGADSNSSRLANSIVTRLLAKNPAAKHSLRDVGTHPHPQLDAEALGALFTPAEKRSPQQAARVALDDALIAEVHAADVVVIGVPMYNFTVPVQLKFWIDAVTRVGATFRYTDAGPEGLLINKTVYLALARGGRYQGTPNDAQVPYLKTLLGFLGITTVHCVYAEGLNMGPEAAQQGFAEADAEIVRLFA